MVISPALQRGESRQKTFASPVGAMHTLKTGTRYTAHAIAPMQPAFIQRILEKE
jgi:hypothetical protein